MRKGDMMPSTCAATKPKRTKPKRSRLFGRRATLGVGSHDPDMDPLPAPRAPVEERGRDN